MDTELKKSLLVLFSAISGAIIGGLLSGGNLIFILEGYIDGWLSFLLFYYIMTKFKKR
ncbi:MAG: hypothetical protein HYT22_02205 [Candidatus Niyogibacteria bacterium]|nr:hypothetical protein [Candidatus Niyogibacteria bacterium]